MINSLIAGDIKLGYRQIILGWVLQAVALPVRCASTYKELIMKARLLFAALGAGLCVLPSVSLANQPLNYVEEGWSWSGNLDSLTINPDVAKREHIGTTAFMAGVAAEHFNSLNEFTYSFGLNFISYDDKDPFPQYTNRGWRESNATAMMVYTEAGTRYRFGHDDMNFLVVKGGASSIFGSERSIDHCSDCDTENIRVNAGLYGVVGIGHSFDSLDVTINFQQYFVGDLNSSLSLKISSTF